MFYKDLLQSVKLDVIKQQLTNYAVTCDRFDMTNRYMYVLHTAGAGL